MTDEAKKSADEWKPHNFVPSWLHMGDCWHCGHTHEGCLRNHAQHIVETHNFTPGQIDLLMSDPEVFITNAPTDTEEPLRKLGLIKWESWCIVSTPLGLAVARELEARDD